MICLDEWELRFLEECETDDSRATRESYLCLVSIQRHGFDDGGPRKPRTSSNSWRPRQLASKRGLLAIELLRENQQNLVDTLVARFSEWRAEQRIHLALTTSLRSGCNAVDSRGNCQSFIHVFCLRLLTVRRPLSPHTDKHLIRLIHARLVPTGLQIR